MVNYISDSEFLVSGGVLLYIIHCPSLRYINGRATHTCRPVSVCVSLISTRAAPFSRVFLGTYNLLVVIVDKVPSSCGSIVSSRSQAFEG